MEKFMKILHRTGRLNTSNRWETRSFFVVKWSVFIKKIISEEDGKRKREVKCEYTGKAVVFQK